jgi:MOSC domain-containing protein YiiM
MDVEVVSVNVAQPSILLRWPSGDVVSGIDKRPVDGDTLVLRRLNLDGDAQADMRPTPAGDPVHGGADQAVYAFPAEHFPALSELVGRPVGPGFVGENVTTRGVTEDDVRIGDVWAWGSARLQVTAPRGPCYKLGIRMGKQAMRTAVRGQGLVGWYLRVLDEGEVPVAGPIAVEERDPVGLTVGAVHRALQDRTTAYPDLAAHPSLSPKVRLALRLAGRDLTGGVPERD